MQFRTQYDRIAVNSNTGERFHPTYELQVDENGIHDLVETGKVDTYEMIQSYKDSVDIHNILERFANGDQTALNKNQPMFGDFTEMPKTMAEFQQTLADAEKMFMSLPVEKRALFNHSVSEFVASFGSRKFFEAFGIETQKSDEIRTNVLIDEKDGDKVE